MCEGKYEIQDHKYTRETEETRQKMASYTYDKAELVSRLMAAKVATGKTFDDIALELGTEIYRYAVKKEDKIKLSSLTFYFTIHIVSFLFSSSCH